MHKATVAVVVMMFLGAVASFGDDAAGTAVPGRVFIAIADVETGRALVPEGTIIPAGVTFHVDHLRSETADSDEPSADRQQLVFAYAPESAFAEARRAIGVPTAFSPGAVEVIESPEAEASGTSAMSFPVLATDTPTWFYLYFADGSYLAVLRHRYDSSGKTSWGVSTKVYSAPGEYYKGTLRPKQSSNLVWGPTGGPYFDPYEKSATCYTDGAGGTCQTALPYVETQTATVSSQGMIVQRYAKCLDPEATEPCLDSYSGTIRTTVPW